MKITAFALCLLCSGCSAPAFADEARKIDFTAPVIDQNGKPAHEADEKSPILTLGDLVAAALYRSPTLRQGEQADPIKLAKRAMLANRLHDAKDATLTAEEVVEIKASIGVFPPLSVLRVIEAIDPASLK